MTNNSEKINVGVVGAQGYTGIMLVKYLSTHPMVNITSLFSRDPEWSIEHEHPQLKNIPHFHPDTMTSHLENIDVCFLATPTDVSMTLVPKLLQANKKVIDLSGAFRLTQAQFTDWYHQSHTAPEYLNQATYGLSPFNPAHGNLIANPGCYATAVLMTLLPLLQAGLIDPEHIIIDAKSGVSGAGKGNNKNLLMGEMTENFYPYKTACHQHLPEIIQAAISYANIKPVLNTQLLPIKQGILASIYTKPLNNDNILEQIDQAYQNAYKDYPLAEWKTFHTPHINTFLGLNKLANTPKVHIAYGMDQDTLVLFGAIDNLGKGAASQAIENLNSMNDWPIETGLWEMAA